MRDIEQKENKWSCSMFIPDARKAEKITELRRQIADFGAVSGSVEEAETGPQVIDLGTSGMAAMLSGGGLACGALHEVRASDYRDMSASISFAAALAVLCARTFPGAPILWCEGSQSPFDVGRLYGPGLAAFGLDPARLILVSPSSAVDLLWTMEEALRLGVFAAVIGEIDGRAAALTLTATRRLHLAAEASGRPALLLTGHSSAGTSATATRWCVTSSPSRTLSNNASLVGRIGWRIRLERCRASQTGTLTAASDRAWRVEWDAHTQRLCDVPDINSAAVLPQPLSQTG
tara:strand:+ start:130 stop:999 length:870 start_codon:yes stop_codon:yes gene_type:complete